MITVYYRYGEIIVSKKLAVNEKIPDSVVWVDIQSESVLDSGQDDKKEIEQQLKIEIPSSSEVWKNHVLNRLYMEDGVAYMTAALITKIESPYPETSAVTFILTNDCLVTIRNIAPTSFNNFANRLLRPTEKFKNAGYVLEGLMEEIITRVAHNSEVVVDSLDKLSHSIFGAGEEVGKGQNISQMMKDVLKSLGACADLNSKINESLHSISRMLNFFKQGVSQDAELDNNIAILMNDAQFLSQQTSFLSDKITFQLDATLGMINVEQNLIIKIFSVVAVFFMPPTLVSSLYGMNFEYMPELKWMYGYPAAIFLMVLCALTPYLYFRKKGWL